MSFVCSSCNQQSAEVSISLISDGGSEITLSLSLRWRLTAKRTRLRLEKATSPADACEAAPCVAPSPPAPAPAPAGCRGAASARPSGSASWIVFSWWCTRWTLRNGAKIYCSERFRVCRIVAKHLFNYRLSCQRVIEVGWNQLIKCKWLTEYETTNILPIERLDLRLDAVQIGVPLLREHLVDLTAHPGLLDMVPVRSVLVCEQPMYRYW